MGYNPMEMLPAEWKCDVTVEQSGGKDSRNNPRPPKIFTWPRVMIAARSTGDPLDYSDLVENRCVLYAGPESIPFVPSSTDVVIVPAGNRMAGRWVVRGRPSHWPMGWEILLDRENATTDRPARTA